MAFPARASLKKHAECMPYTTTTDGLSFLKNEINASGMCHAQPRLNAFIFVAIGAFEVIGASHCNVAVWPKWATWHLHSIHVESRSEFFWFSCCSVLWFIIFEEY